MENKVSVVANVWIKQMEFQFAGDKMEGHKHTFDHQTLLAYGKFKVTVNGIEHVYDAPTILCIKAGYKHEITCLSEKGVGYCIHPLRDGERVDDIVDPDELHPAYDMPDTVTPFSRS